MIRPEDCKPGVEVIAIKNHPYTFKLSIGMIYTIHKYEDSYCAARTLKIKMGAVISLNEVSHPSDFIPAFKLDQFKLRDPNELIELFRLNSIDPDLLKEKTFENI